MEKYKNLDETVYARYIDTLTNKIYSILPLYEEKYDIKQLENKINNLIYNIEGLLPLLESKTYILLDIITILHTLKNFSNHKEIRSCVLQTCALLQNIKDG